MPSIQRTARQRRRRVTLRRITVITLARFEYQGIAIKIKLFYKLLQILLWLVVVFDIIDDIFAPFHLKVQPEKFRSLFTF